MSVDRGGQAIEHLVQYIDLEKLRADSVTPLAIIGWFSIVLEPHTSQDVCGYLCVVPPVEM